MNSSSTSSSVFIFAATASIAVSRLLRLASGRCASVAWIVDQHQRVAVGIEAFGELLFDVLDLVAENIFAAVAGECDEVQIYLSGRARRQLRNRLVHALSLCIHDLLGRAGFVGPRRCAACRRRRRSRHCRQNPAQSLRRLPGPSRRLRFRRAPNRGRRPAGDEPGTPLQ
jgi:hypothetical protein